MQTVEEFRKIMYRINILQKQLGINNIDINGHKIISASIEYPHIEDLVCFSNRMAVEVYNYIIKKSHIVLKEDEFYIDGLSKTKDIKLNFIENSREIVKIYNKVYNQITNPIISLLPTEIISNKRFSSLLNLLNNDTKTWKDFNYIPQNIRLNQFYNEPEVINKAKVLIDGKEIHLKEIYNELEGLIDSAEEFIMGIN